MPNRDLTATGSLTTDLAVTGTRQERIAGRYELREKIGAGGMSTVYLAHDHKNAVDVAIKFMKSDLGGSARRRFFREFNTIASVQHPCCLQVYEIGETQEAPYFTMELHPGRPVTSILGDPPEVVAPMLVDLTLAVDYIHSKGIVHRDIKPSNVMVHRTGGKEVGQLSCKLADFGLAKFYQLDSSLTNERGLVGTPAYCAPEQIEGDEVDHRTDLYAIGILAFELLSGGRHPFAAARNQGIHALLHAQLATAAPVLSDVNPHITAAVSDVVGSYLAKEPELRPRSALPLRRVLCETYHVEVDSRLEQISSPSEVVLNAVGFVCREPELKQVDLFLQQRIHPNSGSTHPSNLTMPLLLFTGEPGTGKTCIMQEAVRRVVGASYQVFTGRCFDGSASSFQPIIEILRQIFGGLARSENNSDDAASRLSPDRLQGDQRRMWKVLHQYQTELLVVAPELRRWLPREAQASVIRSDSEYIFRAISAMLVELSQVSAMCLCFDDIQWADTSTLTLLQHLAATIQQTSSEHPAANASIPSMAVLCTGRSGHRNLQKFQNRMEARSLMTQIEMNTFSSSDTRSLLALRLGCMAGSVTEELVGAIDGLCQGNPFFISETIREWHTRGMVVRTSDGWQRVHSTIDDESSLPTTVRSALRMRINDLSETAKLLMPAAATIGRVVDLDLLGEIVQEVGESELLDAVDELMSKRVLVETNTASRVAFAHDLLREAVQAELGAGRKRALHRRIAAILDKKRSLSTTRVSAAVLAQHYLAGEMTEQAFQCLLEAAEEAHSKYAFEDAIELLRQAEVNQPNVIAEKDRFRLYSMTGDALAHVGEMKRSAEVLVKALKCDCTPIERARMLRLLGIIACHLESWREGFTYLDQALESLGMPRRQSRFSQLWEIPFNVFAFHLIPKWLLSIITRSARRRDHLDFACEIYFSLMHRSMSHDLLLYLQVSTRLASYAKTAKSDVAKGLAFSKYAVNLAFGGFNTRLFWPDGKPLAVRIGESAMRHIASTERMDLEALIGTAFGFCYYAAGDQQKAEALALEAEQTLRHCRELNLGYCYHLLRHVYSIMGEPDKILARAEQELEVATTMNDREIAGWAHYGFCHGYTLAGRSDAALASADLAIEMLQERDSKFQAVALMEQGFALIHASRYAEAVDSFNRAYAIIKKRFFFIEIPMLTFPRMVEAALGPSWQRGKEAEDCNLRLAKKFARRARFFSLWFPNIRPHTWRSLGRLHFAQGRTARAHKCFERAMVEADKIGAKYDHARALFDSAVARGNLPERKQQALDELANLGAVLPQADFGATK